MKRFVCTLFTLVLIACFSLRVSASESMTIDYEALFDQAATIGHDDTEYISTIKAAYEKNPTAFLDALSEMDEDTIFDVVWFWIEGNSTLDALYMLRTNVIETPNSAKYAVIISMLNEHIIMQGGDVYSLEQYMPYEDPDAPFSVPLLRLSIDLNIANKTYDTDVKFNHMLASAYETSPVTFAEILCGYTAPNIENLAKCIAADYKKQNKSAPSVTHDNQSVEIAEIISLIQTEIENTVNEEPQNDEAMENQEVIAQDKTPINFEYHQIIMMIAAGSILALSLVSIILKNEENYFQNNT